MKNLKPKLIRLFKEGYCTPQIAREGYCTPQIARIARNINEPSATIHYNIKKLEEEGAIRTYNAVFDHRKIDEGFCVYVLIKLTAKAGSDPDMVAGELAKNWQNTRRLRVLTFSLESGI
jgi:DNA-binding Lrp family transcriptional regulator